MSTASNRTATLILAALLLSACADRVVLTNTSGSAGGLLVDGQWTTGSQIDRRFTTAGPVVAVGNATSATSTDEVLAFTRRRPVAGVTPAGWTSSVDRLYVAFQNEITIPISVWIVQGPFEVQHERAIDACIVTSAIWDVERMGVRFSNFSVKDATSNLAASGYLAFDCTQKGGIQSDIGADPNRINVYIVDTVQGGTGSGHACGIGSDFIALGSTASPDLLAHELGHNFSLYHSKNPAHFDETNVMDKSSIIRQYLTEGQIFRAHFDPISALNDEYGARAGQPTRTCDNVIPDALIPYALCPAVQKRIWADGTYPPN